MGFIFFVKPYTDPPFGPLYERHVLRYIRRATLKRSQEVQQDLNIDFLDSHT